MSDENLVLYAVDGEVGILTLNRPEKLNALNREMMSALKRAFDQADSDPSTAVVVLRGNGRSFCVGYDLAASSESTMDVSRWQSLLDEEVVFESMPWNMKKPVIASVRGHALGGGCELAMMCDLTIASDDAVFGEPEIRFSVSGPLFIMPWLVPLKKARELLYFGDTIDAVEAVALGMINRVVPADELDASTLRFAHRLSKIGLEALSATKAAINRGMEASGLPTALQTGAATVLSLYAGETAAGRAFKEKAKAEGVAAAAKWRNQQFR